MVPGILPNKELKDSITISELQKLRFEDVYKIDTNIVVSKDFNRKNFSYNTLIDDVSSVNAIAPNFISIKIDDDNRWEGGPSGTDEYLQIELYEPGGALTVAPGDANGNSTTISEAKIYIEDNEASEPVLTFYQETTTANEHDDLWIYIVVDGDIGVGNVAGVSPTFTWEIVDGSSNAAIVDEAEHSGSYIDHSSSTTGDITFDENSYHNVGGNGNRQATRLYYRSYNDSRSELEEQLEIRFKAASNTHCVITGGTYATHIHKITDYDWNQICAYGDCYPEPYFTNATRSVNESGTSGNGTTRIALDCDK